MKEWRISGQLYPYQKWRCRMSRVRTLQGRRVRKLVLLLCAMKGLSP